MYCVASCVCVCKFEGAIRNETKNIKKWMYGTQTSFFTTINHIENFYADAAAAAAARISRERRAFDPVIANR